MIVETADIDALKQILATAPPTLDIASWRRRFDALGAVDPREASVVVTPVSVAGIPGEWSLAPGADIARVLLYLHGGGYVAGSLDSHRPLVAGIGKAAGMRTLAIAYRLAPEYPFPAALEDAEAAYRFLLAHEYTAQQIVVAGDGAGAGLAVALFQSLRAKGLPQPVCSWLVSPWVDLDPGPRASPVAPADDPLVDEAGLRLAAEAYLGARTPVRHPLASPLHGDLADLPPILIQAGSAERLADDAVRLTGRLAHAHVRVRLSVYPHMTHAWPLWHRRLAEGRRALTEAGAFISRWIRN